MILILTDSNDAHANHLIEKIEIERLPYYRLNLDVASLLNTYYTFRNGNISIKQSNRILNISTEDDRRSEREATPRRLCSSEPMARPTPADTVMRALGHADAERAQVKSGSGPVAPDGSPKDVSESAPIACAMETSI